MKRNNKKSKSKKTKLDKVHKTSIKTTKILDTIRCPICNAPFLPKATSCYECSLKDNDPDWDGAWGKNVGPVG